MNTQFTSTKELSAKATFAVIEPGMTVEYSDPANDSDSGNFAKVVAKDVDVYNMAVTSRLANRWLVLIELCNGRKETISAGQILGYSK